jgi:hypothetical protein
MLVKKGDFWEKSTLLSKDSRTAFAKVDVTVVHARARDDLIHGILDLCGPGFSVRFPDACFGACRLVSDIGKHDFTGWRSETWILLVCVVLSCVAD